METDGRILSTPRRKQYKTSIPSQSYHYVWRKKNSDAIMYMYKDMRRGYIQCLHGSTKTPTTVYSNNRNRQVSSYVAKRNKKFKATIIRSAVKRNGRAEPFRDNNFLKKKRKLPAEEEKTTCIVANRFTQTGREFCHLIFSNTWWKLLHFAENRLIHTII